MDWMRTNDSYLDTWARRTPRGNYTQTSSNGIAPEYSIELANTLGQDAWFCIPHLADDNYVRELARLVQGTLDPSLKAYVEYSNETWNNIFDQYDHVNAMGLLLGLDGDPILAGHKYHAKRSAEIWEIWEQEFVQDSRIVKVLASQSAGSYFAGIRASALTDPAINPTGVVADVMAVAPYFGHVFSPSQVPNGFPTQDQILDQDAPSTFCVLRNELAAHRLLAETEGYDLVAYEAGQHYVGDFVLQNDPLFLALMLAVNRDPRMYGLYIDYMDLLHSAGLNLVDNFNYCRTPTKSGSWGVLELYLIQISEKTRIR